MSTDPDRPNIVLILADNLGWGELGCYGGGELRGAPTPRIDAFAKEGLLLHNFNVESDCVPTRSALMSGRHPIRTGCLQSVPPGLPQGLTPWEKTLPEILKGAGYTSAHFGKWHLGDVPGRFPSDRGFDEWYGIARTSDETQFPTSIGFAADVCELGYIMQGKAGSPSEKVCVYDLDQRRRIDHDLVEKAKDWLSRQVRDTSNQDDDNTTQNPFFLYHPLVHLHFPTLPHEDFAGKTNHGDFADSMVEMDHRVGQLLDHIATFPQAVRDNTITIFASDNGPEFRPPYRGTAGPWTGTYHTAMEGSLRVPCIMRWPGHIQPATTSNSMVHVTDLFTTLISIASGGGNNPDPSSSSNTTPKPEHTSLLPTDRPIDGINQLPFLTCASPATTPSARDGFLFYIKSDLRAIKWREWKLHLIWEPKVNSGQGKLESPYLFNTTRDPKEESDVLVFNTWVLQPMMKMQAEFTKSLKHDPAPRDPMKEEYYG